MVEKVDFLVLKSSCVPTTSINHYSYYDTDLAGVGAIFTPINGLAMSVVATSNYYSSSKLTVFLSHLSSIHLVALPLSTVHFNG